MGAQWLNTIEETPSWARRCTLARAIAGSSLYRPLANDTRPNRH
jgi:hypothetical protein